MPASDRDSQPKLASVSSIPGLPKAHEMTPASVTLAARHVKPRHPSMTDPENLPEDFPPESFSFFAFCEDCRHSAAVERARIPAGISLQRMRHRLRCSACGSRSVALRIVYTGAGGFRHDGDRPLVVDQESARGEQRPLA
jgi:hypothetical protein